MAAITTQSAGLSERHLNMHQEGRTLVTDSNVSEGNLKTMIEPLIRFAKTQIEPYGGTIDYHTKLSLEDIMQYGADDTFLFPSPEQQKEQKEQKKLKEGKEGKEEKEEKNDNARVSIRPDAGILLWRINNKHYPIYIGEDKVQGTNDRLFLNGQKKQATGNAIERYFKNVRAEELLCCRVPYFPSVCFASGCDFHHSETIAKRLEAGNYGVPNLYAEITKEQPDIPELALSEKFIDNINIMKKWVSAYVPYASVPIVCVKAHKWDQMPHSSSLWLPSEYLEISKQIVSQAVKHVHQIVLDDQHFALHQINKNEKKNVRPFSSNLY